MASPLTKDHLDEINNALRGIKAARDVVQRAKLAKIDVTIQEAQMDEAESKLLAIKQGFFPSGRA